MIDRTGIIRCYNSPGPAASTNAIGKSIFDLTPDWPDLQAAVHRALCGETVLQHTQVSGTHYETHYSPVFDHDCQVNGVVGVTTEITNPKPVELTLLDTDATFCTAVEKLVDGFTILNPIRAETGRITGFNFVYANPAAQTLFRLPAGKLHDCRLRDLVPVEQGTQLLHDLRQVVETGVPLVQDGLEVMNPGQSIVLDLRAVRSGDSLACIWRNVTEPKEQVAELSEVQHRLLASVETGRRHLAQTLHDGPIQDLFGMDYQLHGLDEANLNLASKETLDNVQTILHNVICKLQETCGNLLPTTLAPFGLKKAILSHAERFQEDHPDIQLNLDLAADNQLLPEPLRLGLFRIYQNAMDNAGRYARASQITVVFQLKENQASLEVRDNGLGFEKPRRWVKWVREGRLGLVSAQERAEAIGGHLVIESHPGQGTCIRISAPIQRQPND